MTVNSLLKKSGTGFDVIIIQDKDSGDYPAYFGNEEEARKDYGKWKVDSWEVGFNVSEKERSFVLMITV